MLAAFFGTHLLRLSPFFLSNCGFGCNAFYLCLNFRCNAYRRCNSFYLCLNMLTSGFSIVSSVIYVRIQANTNTFNNTIKGKETQLAKPYQRIYKSIENYTDSLD